MSGVNWEDEDEFSDNPVTVRIDPNTGKPDWTDADTLDTHELPRPAPQPRPPVAQQSTPRPVAPEPEEEETLVVMEEDDEEDYSNALSDARLRIEQGRLYEMVMNNDIFQDTDVDPRAVKFVQREIRRFAKERMEVMLGMRQEASFQQGSANVVLPFNDLEISILKTLASKATNGATESPDANKYSNWKEKKVGLTPIGSPKVSKPATPSFALSKKPAPLARQAKPKQTLPPEFEPDYKPLEKPASMLTEAELIQRNKELAERQRGKQSVKNASALPMPSVEQQEILFQQRALDAKAKGTGLSVAAILNVMNSAAKK